MIRESTISDIDQIIRIWLNASISSHSFIAVDYWLGKVSDMRNIYLPQAKTYVYANSRTGRAEGFISMVGNSIAAIFVMPNMQKKG